MPPTNPGSTLPPGLLDQRALAHELGVTHRQLRYAVTAKRPHVPPPSGRVGLAYVWRADELDLTAIRAAWPGRGRPRKHPAA